MALHTIDAADSTMGRNLWSMSRNYIPYHYSLQRLELCLYTRVSMFRTKRELMKETSHLYSTTSLSHEIKYIIVKRPEMSILTENSVGTMFFCCIFKCRVPRTKQEIEADYIRRQLAQKFHRQLNIINNSEMDEMDLLKALERLRAELRADSNSLAQSEAFSTLSFTPTGTPTYRKGSELYLGVSVEDLRLATTQGHFNHLKSRVTNIISGALRKLKH
ncbi:uncharacterized protein LOC125031060 [Penaeus chinensis]|uniref:uncharacterized protein LOC125031060 n=1 Tax=Penaeus chinensis TaxID=139456 RepID=UPI001FB71CDE|nr:uncharacterized protein LOC125031060 [Penaeus chinensis]